MVIWFCTYHLVTTLWYQYDMPYKMENWNKLRRQRKYQKQSEKDDIDWESGL